MLDCRLLDCSAILVNATNLAEFNIIFTAADQISKSGGDFGGHNFPEDLQLWQNKQNP